LKSLERKDSKKFAGQFDALTKMGTDFVNQQRFRALHGEGKPLWEFKEHDHRLYCSREVFDGDKISVTLFNGWTKDKEGRTRREDTEIEKALSLHGEFLTEGGRV
jgi:hypothetical protein